MGSILRIGLDVNVERHFRHGYYFLFTGSVYQSLYTGGNGRQRSSAYDQPFVVNLLGGREYTVRKNNLLGINGKIYDAGWETACSH